LEQEEATLKQVFAKYREEHPEAITPDMCDDFVDDMTKIHQKKLGSKENKTNEDSAHS